jgi:hypothetical protein
MLPTDMVALAEARRESLEQEIRYQHLLSQLPQQPARWRRLTGSSLMWAGERLVNWGEGMATTSRARHIEVVG